MVHSATSSCTNDSWGTGYSEGPEQGDAGDDVHWEQDSDDVLTVPKMEPVEDDEFHMDEVKEAPRTPRPSSSTGAAVIKAKRPRGRPRKHPLTPQVSANKIAKGRSKTGCITCRKRKKKCDEAKPRCMNCEKNAVVCEGYNEKTIWKSGREKAEEERRRSLPLITLQPIFKGVETPEDMIFLHHYINHLSGVLTVESQHKNAFKDMLLQMAVEHRGLMHSILSLASEHIDYETPYGAKILESNGRVTKASLQARSEFHHNQAMHTFYEDIGREQSRKAEDGTVNLSVRYGQMLCLLLKSIANGSHNGEHRLHLQAYKNLIQDSPPDDSGFLIFITEFFQFYVFADELMRYPQVQVPRLALETWEPWMTIQPARLIGVSDGLFKYLTQITTIRNTIRTNILARIDPVVDYTSLYRAAEIDAAIRDWTPHWPPGDSRERDHLPPSSSSPPPVVVGQSFGAITCSGHSPPLSPTSPVHAHARHEASNPAKVSNSNQASSSHRADSPQPIRYPPHHDSRITVAVDESLAILESFKPSDPVQTLLLIPCLVIGCASFAPSQRSKVQDAVRAVRGYTGLRNCDLLLEVLATVWQLMDQGEWTQVWDWQGVAQTMGLDFACA
ncbi:fungal-specific transcription factor domain-containing protein [Apiospora kogelbergensis]|uniref:Fungal-specific transcription factor domain-containing protein n=1 Tax=Apiospora kogelbergensis TaxID=1337665 RepID=A0AAW0Q5B9_9PEZI